MGKCHSVCGQIFIPSVKGELLFQQVLNNSQQFVRKDGIRGAQ